MTSKETQYRIYADGTVVHEDDFEEYDGFDDSQPFGDDYRTVSVPDEVIEHIADSCSLYPAPQFYTERAKNFYYSRKGV
ncbi:MAG: hypothetical protein D3906_09845 [Candidatus Electrothrix sp. AUS1_2]|nr:hypothetical protein [Candidatus Electrothrix sp. AUS1_2]